MSARWCVELADDGSNFGGIRTEIRELLTAMSVIREELAAIRTDILWLKNITGGFQGDIDELKAFRWRVYGVSAGVSAAVSVAMCFLS